MKHYEMDNKTKVAADRIGLARGQDLCDDEYDFEFDEMNPEIAKMFGEADQSSKRFAAKESMQTFYSLLPSLSTFSKSSPIGTFKMVLSLSIVSKRIELVLFSIIFLNDT